MIHTAKHLIVILY